MELKSFLTILLLISFTSIVNAASAPIEKFVVLNEYKPNEAYVPVDFYIGVFSTDAGNKIARTLVKFDLTAFKGKEISSAKLVLNAQLTKEGTSKDPQTLEIYAVMQPWADATWNTAPSYSGIVQAYATITADGSYEIDLTSLVQTWIADTNADYGILLKSIDETNLNFKQFKADSYLEIVESAAPTAGITSEEAACADSDRGINYIVLGNTYGIERGKEFSYTDECVTGTILREYYCASTQEPTAVAYECPAGCGGSVCLLDCDARDTLLEGQTQTYTIEGLGYEVSVTGITDTGTILAKFSVNGETTESLSNGNSYILADGTMLTIIQIMPNEAGDITQDEVEFCIKKNPACSDGTPYGECSKTMPLYCSDGELVDDCNFCGCPSCSAIDIYNCDTNGRCSAKIGGAGGGGALAYAPEKASSSYSVNQLISKDKEGINRLSIETRPGEGKTELPGKVLNVQETENGKVITTLIDNQMYTILQPANTSIAVKSLSSKGFIAQLKEKPVLEKKTEVKEEINILRERSSQYEEESKSAGIFWWYKQWRADSLENEADETEAKLPALLKEQKDELIKEHEKALIDFKERVKEKNIIGEYKNAFNGVALDISQEEANEIKKSKYVKNVYPNREVKAALMDSVPLINADDVWLLDEDGNQCAVSGKECLTGEGVTIAVIDTGIDYTHPDLGGCFGVDCKVLDGYDFVNNDNDPMDDQGHGTHVAATAAGNDQSEPIDYGKEYTQFIGFPDRFFSESIVPSEQIIEVVDAQYLSLKEMHNGISPYNNLIVEYDPDVYGSTTPTGLALGDSAFPSLNNGNPRWEVMAHEQGHNFFGGTSAFYGSLAFPYSFLQESFAVLSAFYTYNNILNYPQKFGIDSATIDSLNFDFTNGRNYQEDMYNKYISTGKNFNIDDVLTSQALDYKMIVYGETYGWEFYKKFAKAFENGIADQFTFQEDGASSIEQSTYVIAALNVAFNQDFREEFQNLNFPVDENLYSDIYSKIKNYIESSQPVIGLKGVAPDAKLYAYKVLDSTGSGYESQIIAAIERAVDPNNDGDYDDHLDIISMSLGGDGNPDDSMSQAIDNAVDNGVVAVIAAGNSGDWGYKTIGSPGTARKAITVGASDKNDQMAYFSSKGPVVWGDETLIKPDLTAPGVDICAAQWDDAFEDYGGGNCNNDDNHVAISGTSMATPHVSGAAALIKQAHPDWTPDDIKSALKQTAVELIDPETGNPYDIFTQGTGRIDILKAIEPEIIVLPSSLDFGNVLGVESVERQLLTKNMMDREITITVDGGDSTNEDVSCGGLLSFSSNSFVLQPFEAVDIEVLLAASIVPSGDWSGKISVNTDSNSYKIPYTFKKKQLLNLTIKSEKYSEEELAPGFILFSEDNSFVKGSWWGWDFDGLEKSFEVNAGKYTAVVTGSMNEYSVATLSYILIENIEIKEEEGNKEVIFDLDSAKPYGFNTSSEQGKPLDRFKWAPRVFHCTEFVENPNSWDENIPCIAGGMGWGGFGFDGSNTIIYMNNFAKEGNTFVDVTVAGTESAIAERDSLSSGEELRMLEREWAISDERYVLNWNIHEINDLTPSFFDYDTESMTKINVVTDYPGYSPVDKSNLLFLFAPTDVGDGGWDNVFVPLNMSLKVINQNPNVMASFSTNINYILPEKEDDFFYLLTNQQENTWWLTNFSKGEAKWTKAGWTNPQIYWPYNKIPISYRKIPLTFTNFTNTNDWILFADQYSGWFEAVYGYTKDITVFHGIYEDKIEQGRLKVYLDNLLIESREICTSDLRWSSNWSLACEGGYRNYVPEDGNYLIEMIMPSLYPSMAYTNITASFRIPSDDVNPPYIEHFDIPVSYHKGEEFNISIGAKDDKQLGSVKAQYYDDAWREITLTTKDGKYTGKISTSSDKIDLRIILDDNSQNSMIYTFTNISFAKEELDIELYSASEGAYPGEKIQFRGRVRDVKRKGIYLLYNDEWSKIDVEGKTVKAEPSIGEAVIYVDSESALSKEGETKEINGLSITLKKSDSGYGGYYYYALIEVDYSYVPKLVLNYLVNGEFVSKGATWNEWWEDEKIFGRGEFAYDYTIPFDYALEKLDFSVQFDGAGIYMPQKEDITVDVVKYNHDIAVSGLVYGPSEKGVLKINNLTTFNATIYNVGSKTEKNIPVNFAINGEIIDTKTIEQLEPAESGKVSFEWTPTEPGSYEISIGIDYNKDENPNNNEALVKAEVIIEGPNIHPYIDNMGNFIVNQSNSLSLTIENTGTTTATNIESTVYDLFEYEYTYPDYDRTERIYFNNTEYELILSNVDDDSALISIAYNGITEEFNLSEGSLRRLGDGVVLVLYQLYDDYTYIILGKDSSVAEASLPDLKPDSISENEISTTPTTLGYHLYYVFVNTTADIDWADNYNLDEIKAVRDEADIEVWLDAGYSIVINQTTEIHIYLKNMGSKTATNVNATFYDLYNYEYWSLYYDLGSSIDFDGTTYNIIATKVDDERVELKVSYDETEKDAILREGGALEIGNGVVINVLYIMDDSAEAIIAKALLQKINFADLEPDENAEETIEWTAGTQGSHMLSLFVNTIADGDWSNNNHYRYVDVKADGPDARGWIDYSSVIVNQQNNITADITNEGTKTATDVAAYLYLSNITEIIEKPIPIEGEESSGEEATEEIESLALIGSVYIGDLDVYEYKTIIFNWTPDKVGYNNLKLVVNATLDVDLSDNEYYTTLYVGPNTPDLKAYLYLGLKGPVALQRPVNIGVNLQNRGTKAEGITSKLYDGSTLLDTKTIEELGSDDWYWYEYEWTPETKGMHTIKVVAEAPNDYNSSDNSYSMDIEVLSIINATFNITNPNKEPVEKYLMVENPFYYGWINAPTEIEILERTNILLADVDKDENNGIGTRFQSSIAKPDMNIISEYYIEEMAQDGLLLYAVYANKAYWEYNYSTFLVSAEKNYLKISRLDDIEIFYCTEWDFSSKNCTSGWHKSEFKKDLWGNNIYAEAFAPRAEAFAIADFDIDEDNKPDWQDEDDDNDEIPDDKDMLSCKQKHIPSNMQDLELRINGSYNLSQIFNETMLVEFVKENKTILKVDFPFGEIMLKCRETLIEKQEAEIGKGYILVNGLNLVDTTKTLYMDKIAATNKVCIKDEEVFSIEEMSANCDAEGEVLINCDGTQQNNYTCNNLGDRYEITGLKNSAVQEYTPPATPPPEEDVGGEDSGSRRGREYLSPVKQCFDRRDNDGDGLIDWPEDTGCYSKFDNDERDQYEEEKPITTTPPTNSELPAPPTAPPATPSKEVPKEEKLKLPEDMSEIYGYIALILALTIILGSTGFVFIELKIRKGAKIRKQMQAVQDYAKKELERGFSREDIRNKLLGVGWKKETVDDVFKNIKK